MLLPRLIPCLLLRGGGLVKTTKFGEPKYIGDPLNAVRIFNEKQVDELVFLDIDATKAGREPNYELLSVIARECRMPLCYGGGVRKADQVERLVGLGIEKVAMGAAAFEEPQLISDAAKRVGSQSIVGVIDTKRTGLLRRQEVMVRNASVATAIDPVAYARRLRDAGAGELLVQSVDRDGTGSGYDLDLVEAVRAAVDIPITALGGVGELDHVTALVARFGSIGAGVGSFFVLRGKYRAVLITYPSRAEREALARATSRP
jgi:cyclase